MLRKLVLHSVGPAKDLALEPVAPRLDLLTGDNGLGKSFLLEAAWWASTHAWLYWSPPPGRRPLPLWYIEQEEPFLASELRRQGRLNPEDVSPEEPSPVQGGEPTRG